MVDNSYSMDAIERIESMIDYGCKVLNVEESDEYIYISITKGIDISKGKVDVLAHKEKYSKTDDIMKFLKSDKFIESKFEPKTRGIILVDIVGYSKFEIIAQSAILTLLKRAIKQNIFSIEIGLPFDPVEQIVPTGDGCYIITSEEVAERAHRIAMAVPTFLHVTQNQILCHEFERNHKEGDRIEVRVGCEIGECDFFYDLSGNRNCYGEALNEAARIATYGQKAAENQFPTESTGGTVFFGVKAYESAKPTLDYLNSSLNLDVQVVDLGDVVDKHGKSRKILWVKNLNKYSALQLYNIQEYIDKGWIKR